jgi:homogentisate 1,2-dioxygenase
LGRKFTTIRPLSTLSYRDAKGPHAPHRLNVNDVDALDADDIEALPTTIFTSDRGFSIAVSGLAGTMPYAYRNVRADEVHFIVDGSLQYRTDCGYLTAEPGDFVFIPRAITYQARTVTPASRRIILEEPLAVSCLAESWVIRPDAIRTAAIMEGRGAFDEARRLVLRTDDGVTEFGMDGDCLGDIGPVLEGISPVFAVNIKQISRTTYFPGGGPPTPFAGTVNNETLFFTISGRPASRQPMHYNADYDEITLYFEGPAPRGGLDEPGTMVWIPKGIGHHGGSEDGELWAWLVETKSTLRLSAQGLAPATWVDPEGYGPHFRVGSRTDG